MSAVRRAMGFCLEKQRLILRANVVMLEEDSLEQTNRPHCLDSDVVDMKNGRLRRLQHVVVSKTEPLVVEAMPAFLETMHVVAKTKPLLQTTPRLVETTTRADSKKDGVIQDLRPLLLETNGVALTNRGAGVKTMRRCQKTRPPSMTENVALLVKDVVCQDDEPMCRRTKMLCPFPAPAFSCTQGPRPREMAARLIHSIAT